MSWFVGVDVGGTFTDVVLANDRRRRAHRQGADHARRPARRRRRRRRGRCCADAGRRRRPTSSRFVHGTTLATNVILEQPGGAGRVRRPPRASPTSCASGREARVEDDRYDLFFTTPAAARRPAAHVRGARAHRRRRRRARRARPTTPSPTSSRRSPRPRRPASPSACCTRTRTPSTSAPSPTRCARALPGHVRGRVLRGLARDARVRAGDDHGGVRVRRAGDGRVPRRARGAARASSGSRAPLEIMDSSGGVMSARARGPPPGADRRVGRRRRRDRGRASSAGAVGADDVISFDMGGTTAKAGIVRDGRPAITHDFQVGGKGSFGGTRAGTGFPSRSRSSTSPRSARAAAASPGVDAGGALRVGPRSAGAEPGPACYGRGGTEPTVTDADLVLGYLDPAGLAGGVTLSPDARARRDRRDGRASARPRHRSTRRVPCTTSSTPTWPPRSGS